MNENGEYVRGREIGRIIQGMEDLEKTVNNGFANVQNEFKSLDCKPNKEKITEVYTWYKDYKELKKHVFKTVVKVTIPTVSAIGVFATAVYAFFTK